MGAWIAAIREAVSVAVDRARSIPRADAGGFGGEIADTGFV
jgi:hypothetical protein